MAGVSSQGILLQRGDGASPEGFTTVANVKSIDGPSADNPEVDVTSLASSAKEFLAGLQDYGEITGDMNFDPSNSTHQQIRTDQSAGTTSNWRIVFPVSPVVNWTVSAFVKSFSVGAGVDEPLSASLTLRCSGAVTVS